MRALAPEGLAPSFVKAFMKPVLELATGNCFLATFFFLR